MITGVAPVCFSYSLPQPLAKMRLPGRIEIGRSSAASVEPGREVADSLFHLQELRTRHRLNGFSLRTRTPVARERAGGSSQVRRARNVQAQVPAAMNLKLIALLGRPTRRDTLAAANACE